ncbi:MAG: DUF2325 domain-containing protein [Pseudomonadota bacterium]
MCIQKAAAEKIDSQLCAAQTCSSSRRRKLWELPAGAHCSVIGVGVPAVLLRKTLKSVVDNALTMSDYDFHVGAVGHCRLRNPISTVLQKLLDRRFAAAVRVFQAAKNKETLVSLWIKAIDDGDVAGPFWAGLTHPLCTPEIQEAMINDMHLIQHQACAMFRSDTREVESLEKRIHGLAAELGQTRDRHARQIAEKSVLIQNLQQDLSQALGEVKAKDHKILTLMQELAAVCTAVAAVDVEALNTEKTRLLRESNQAYEKRIRALERQLRRKAVRPDIGRQDALAGESSRQELPISADENALVSLKLPAQQVLCVGGRAGNVPDYREVVEKAGAQFVYHDGGIEDNQRLLESGLAAADMVICQTGCISHNAYWRVKDFCKRTGKRCVYVDNPSTSSLIKGLATVACSDMP